MTCSPRPRALVVVVVVVAAAAVSGGACRPELLARPSLIDGVRVLAVRADPAEVPPGAQTALTALVVDERGRVTDEPAWSFCRAAKPLTDNDSVAPACLAETASAVAIPDAAGAVIPADACRLFGPESATPDARPRDADSTGGYYQPVIVDVDGAIAAGQARVACRLGGASIDISKTFEQTYPRNQNPVFAIDVPAHVHRGGAIEAKVSWPKATAEEFPVFDVATQSLSNQREAIEVSWFAATGSFRFDRTGIAAGDEDTETRNTWHAPDAAGSAQLFVVVRDSRGGVSFAVVDIVVE